MKILKNYVFNSLYQILIMFLPLVTAPYISRVLGPEGVGINTFTATVVGYFVLIATLGTSTYGNREIAYHQNNIEKRSQAFWGITLLSWITSFITFFIFLFFLFFVKEYKILYLWQGVAILTTMFDVSWYFVGIENFKIIVTRNFIIKIITVASVFIFVKSQNDLLLYIIITVIGGLLGSLSLWPYLIKQVRKPNFKDLRFIHHFKYSLALFLPTIASSIYSIGQKNLIGILDSVVHAGFFYQSDTVIRLAISLISSVGTVMLPRISNMKSEGKFDEIREFIVRDFNLVIGLAMGISFGVMGISLNFAPFFWGESFEMVGKIMMVESPMALLISSTYIFNSHYFVPMDKIKMYTTTTVIGTVANIVLNLILIPLFGVIGATVVALITEFLIASVQYYYLQKELKLQGLMTGLWKYFISGLIMFSVVFWMNQSFKMTMIQLILQIVVGMFIYVTFNILLRTQLWIIVSLVLRKIKKVY
ncbi:oligosaccharide flippase family protein [Lactococcus lactis]|uniref:oligosaccharide flippase family protein n=1 Tax=Lactococcus lactis TaxID=1358 RepID=UPI0028903F51|nr:oligosaccharide flippase family protein [Lactococcus lactis]MDT2872720.1 oligosaccharide flippase family protein [Lactococcus lactis]